MINRLHFYQSELSKREIEPERPFWIDGQDETYCFDCIHLLFPGAEIEGGGYDEENGSVVCDRCGKLLQYTLTDYGVNAELDYFLEYGWDWNNPEQCFEMARIAYGVFSDEQKERFFKVIKRGINRPSFCIDEAQS